MRHRHTDAHPVRRRPLARLLVGVAAAAAGVLAAAPAASAGGWALTTLDAVPAPVPGEPTEVGFTILQHGVTPVDIDHGVELVVTGPDGTRSVFPAAGDGEPGHYVATIWVPSTGSYRWLVRQGEFGEQSLGMFVTSTGATAGASGWQAPEPLVPSLLAIATVLGGFAVADIVRSRRRPAVLAPGGLAHEAAPRAT